MRDHHGIVDCVDQHDSRNGTTNRPRAAKKICPSHDNGANRNEFNAEPYGWNTVPFATLMGESYRTPGLLGDWVTGGTLNGQPMIIVGGKYGTPKESGRHWQIAVLYGPHGAPDFFTEDDVDTIFATDWEVHFNSNRTGVRLIGPRPEWAREDGGEAGLHPSNIHDNAYAVGTVDFTGDMPVILGPDGPSLGGFVCPVTVISADLWKLGQLKAGAGTKA